MDTQSISNTTLLETHFSNYLSAFETLTPETLENDLSSRWHQQVEFKDPFNHVFDREHCQRIFEHMFTQCIDPKFTVNHKMLNGSVGSAYWTFEFKLSAKDNKPQTIMGNSLIELDSDGLIIKHIDYWDAAEQFYEKIPLIGGLIRLVKKRLRVD